MLVFGSRANTTVPMSMMLSNMRDVKRVVMEVGADKPTMQAISYSRGCIRKMLDHVIVLVNLYDSHRPSRFIVALHVGLQLCAGYEKAMALVQFDQDPRMSFASRDESLFMVGLEKSVEWSFDRGVKSTLYRASRHLDGA